MLRAILAATTVLTATTGAHADPQPEHYIGIGGMIGADVFLDLAASVDAGVHLGGGVWAHALVATGTSGDDQGNGPLRHYRGGVEGRTCGSSSVLCYMVGADLGYHQYVWTSHQLVSPDEHHEDVILAPRVGLDVGGDWLRFRPGAEMYFAVAGDDRGGRFLGLNLTLAVACRF